MKTNYLLHKDFVFENLTSPAEIFRTSLKNILTFLRVTLYFAFFTITASLSFVPLLTYFQYIPDLSSKDTLKNKNNNGLILMDRNNQPFFTFYSPRLKKEIPLEKIPLHLQRAIISVEDKDFFSHPGFSPKSIVRAALSNIEQSDIKYGASTITQQLVKNSLLNPGRNFLRKYQEVILASELERRYSKDEILEMYLNSIYFGRGAFGIEEAAQVYFKKNASDLTLAESAFLTSLLSSPSRLSSDSSNIEEVLKLQKLVLQKMVDQDYIKDEEKAQAESEQITLAPFNSELNSIAPHFALLVRDQLIEQLGEEELVKSGFQVRTTLNLDFQKFAESEVKKQVDRLKGNRVSNGSVVAMDPKTGEILALVGSVNWFDDEFGKVNIATSERPPGSAFKPVIYLRAFEKGIITPATILQDVPTAFANFDEKSYFSTFPSRAAALSFLATDPNAYYKPVNYDRKFRGPVTVRRALANSLNVPSVEVMKKLGVSSDVVNFARDLGITTIKDPENYGLSLVLGTAEVRLLDLTNFYSTLANSGIQNDSTTILSIEDKYGNIIYEYEPKNNRVIDERVAFLVTSILSDNSARKEVFGNVLNLSRPAAVKTGTTDNFKDSWTLGYTPSLTIGVWVGNNFGQTMDNVAGSLGAAPIWKALMEEYLKNMPTETFKPPDGIVKYAACFYRQTLPFGNREATPSASNEEYFIKGTEPKNCPQANQKISRR